MTNDDVEEDMDTQTQPTRRLERRTEGKTIAGVAAGLGDYFGVDPVWFRLGFVVTVFMGGAGIVAYLVLWAVMPEGTGAPTGAERAARSLRGTPAWIGFGLVALGAILMANHAFEWRPGVVWGIALIAFGVLLFVQRDERVEDEGSVVSAPAPAVSVPPGPPGAPPPAPAAPPKSRERSSLGAMTFGALLIAVGVAALLGTQDVIAWDPGQYLALALTIIGAGLIAGAWWGRARWLIVPGLVLVPAVLAASLIDVPFRGGAGERLFRPASVAEVESEYRMIVGDMTIDLSDVTFGPTPTRIEATMVAGQMLVIVPENVPVEVRARAAAGQLRVFGRQDNGLNVEVRRVVGTGEPVLVLDLETSFGEVEVRS